MNRILAGTAIALIFATGARAADYSLPPAATLPWQGFHAGVVGAFGSLDAEVGNGNLGQFSGDTFSHDVDGGLFGFLIGYDWQFGRTVLGLEADLSASTLREFDYEDTSGAGMFTGLSAFGTVRGRLGYAASDQFLLYGTGGLAFGQITQLAGDLSCDGAPCSSSSMGFDDDNAAMNLGDWRVGWTAGVGAEYRLSEAWSVRAEYLYADFGSYTALVPDSITESGSFDNTMHMARIALSHRFGGTNAGFGAAHDVSSSWSGAYAGLTGGFAKLDTDVDDRNLGEFDGNSFATDVDGGLAGLLAGYSWQSGSFVFGVEADVSAAFLDGLNYHGTSDDGVYSNLGALATLRGRVGIAPTDQILLYGTAGVAFAHLTQLAGDLECDAPESACPADQIGFREYDSAINLGKWKTGWTIGAGMDVKLGESWVARGEYLYADLGSYSEVVPDDTARSAEFDNTMHIGRAALIRRF